MNYVFKTAFVVHKKKSVLCIQVFFLLLFCGIFMWCQKKKKMKKKIYMYEYFDI